MKRLLSIIVITGCAVAMSPALAAGPDADTLFHQTCVGCHGENGKGVIPGAPDFTDPKGRLSKPDAVLVDHIMNGFQSPGNSMAMPAHGANPDLTKAEAQELVKYLRGKFLGKKQ